MSSPEEELAHGRAWTYAELSYKSFEDLHALYWVCIKERNRIATAKKERDRVFAGYGDFESESRDREVSSAKSLHPWIRDFLYGRESGCFEVGKAKDYNDENSFHSPI